MAGQHHPEHLPVADIIGVLTRIRQRAPLVHCITNAVVTNFTANTLLAIGASPVMVSHAEESVDMAAAADGLLVNLGTPSPERVQAIRAAIPAARTAGTPWVLDPVGVGALAYRSDVAAGLLEDAPAVIRGNPSEVLSLAGSAGSIRGVDATTDSASALRDATALATHAGTVVAVSGATDYVTDGSRLLTVTGGDPIMTRVTGVGCILGALIAASCAVTGPPLVAAAAGSALLTLAAETAAAQSSGPGSFAVGLLDSLANLDEAALTDRFDH